MVSLRCWLMLLVLCSSGANFAQRSPQPDGDSVLKVPPGPPINVDGVLSQGEWDQAARVEIKVADGWVVTVLAQHDDKNFYIAFTGLRHGNAERYPEVLLDPAAEKSLLWKQGQWWFHASYNLCDSNGKPNNYTTCQPSKQGWNGTRFPLKQGVSEIAISLDKVGLAPGKRFGLAFDITDTKAEWNLWPNSAKLKIPMSWAEAQME